MTNMATTVSIVLLVDRLKLTMARSACPVSLALLVYIILDSPSLTHRQDKCMPPRGFPLA